MVVYNRNEAMLQQVFGELFFIIHPARYAEMGDDDPLLIIARAT
jgi:hypothetical protein